MADVTPPAPPAPPTPASSGASATPPPTQTEWTSGFSDEIKGYIQKKGFKDAGTLAESYVNLEKLHSAGPDKLLKLPESWESPEAQALWERLGKPKDAKGYELKVPEKGGDPKLAEWAADVFHKGNLTASQAQAVMTAWNARQEAVTAQTAENQKMAAAAADTALKQEWGAAFDKNKNLVDAAARVGGMSNEDVAALSTAIGPKKAAELLLKVGNSLTEAAFVAGRPAADGTVTPDQARSQLEDLKRDQGFVQRYLAGDFDAKRKMEHLQKMANPGDMRLT